MRSRIAYYGELGKFCAAKLFFDDAFFVLFQRKMLEKENICGYSMWDARR